MGKTPWGHTHHHPPFTLRALYFRRRAACMQCAGTWLGVKDGLCGTYIHGLCDAHIHGLCVTSLVLLMNTRAVGRR